MTQQAALPTAHLRLEKAEEWHPRKKEIVIGKDILELLSSSMYVDPMTIYREYVQNAADSIDEARRTGVLSPRAAGRVDIDYNINTRSIRIRDNGTGISWSEFDTRLTAFGASTKRGTSSRGFRGVGRLAGLGYCQQLIFRSRAAGEARVSELKWDCRKLKSALRGAEFSGDLAKLVGEVVSVRQVGGSGYPEHFFEVELNGLIRHRNDRLLNGSAVAEYLCQVAPVPFAPDFAFAKEISEALAPHVAMGNIEIRIGDATEPIYRPHRQAIEIGDNVYDPYTGIEVRTLPSSDGGVAAVAWVLHHGYTGAIPAKALVKGLRLRSGNVQVGDGALLEELFPEPRFNAWSVGEIHVVDPRIVPNGRRDHFEQSIHFDNLLNQIGPIARDIARRCRTSSIERKRLRDFQLSEAAVREKLGILRQGTLGARERVKLARDIEASLAAMEKVADRESSDRGPGPRLKKIIQRLRTQLERLADRSPIAAPLSRLSQPQRKMYEHLFGLIYECSANRSAAKALVDRILTKIG